MKSPEVPSRFLRVCRIPLPRKIMGFRAPELVGVGAKMLDLKTLPNNLWEHVSSERRCGGGTYRVHTFQPRKAWRVGAGPFPRNFCTEKGLVAIWTMAYLSPSVYPAPRQRRELIMPHGLSLFPRPRMESWNRGAYVSGADLSTLTVDEQNVFC